MQRDCMRRGIHAGSKLSIVLEQSSKLMNSTVRSSRKQLAPNKVRVDLFRSILTMFATFKSACFNQRLDRCFRSQTQRCDLPGHRPVYNIIFSECRISTLKLRNDCAVVLRLCRASLCSFICWLSARFFFAVPLFRCLCIMAFLWHTYTDESWLTSASFIRSSPNKSCANG